MGKSKITEIETTFTLSGLPRKMTMELRTKEKLKTRMMGLKHLWSSQAKRTMDQAGINDYSAPSITNSALTGLLLDGERKHKEDRKREIICRCPRGQGLPYQHRFCCSREQIM